MELISSAFLGTIQGLTEFLPISSSGHLELISNIFDLSKPDITFDIFVHFGSLFAILLFFKFNYSQSVASDLEINKYLEYRNRKINLQNSISKKKIKRIDHYIWWLKNVDRKSHIVQRGNTDIIILYYSIKFLKKKKLFFLDTLFVEINFQF